MSEAFAIDLPVGDSWSEIEQVRGGVVACLAAVYRDGGMSELAAMVVGELLENAHKYGDPRPGRGCRLRVRGDGEQFEVEVVHPVRRGENTERLFAALEFLAGAKSAQAAYRQRIREVAARPDGSGGLGLFRVACEARCALRAALSDDGMLTLTAVSRLPGEVRAASQPH